MSDKEELRRLIDVLSEYECKHLLNTVQDIAEGERFWEGDFGLLYNEYVKLRYFKIGHSRSTTQHVEEEAFVPIPIVKSYPGVEQVKLPPPEHFGATLSETLIRRRSQRDYSG